MRERDGGGPRRIGRATTSERFPHRSNASHRVSIGRGTRMLSNRAERARSSRAHACVVEKGSVDGIEQHAARCRAVQRPARAGEVVPRVPLHAGYPVPRSTSCAGRHRPRPVRGHLRSTRHSVGSNCTAASPASSLSELVEAQATGSSLTKASSTGNPKPSKSDGNTRQARRADSMPGARHQAHSRGSARAIRRRARRRGVAPPRDASSAARGNESGIDRPRAWRRATASSSRRWFLCAHAWAG